MFRICLIVLLLSTTLSQVLAEEKVETESNKEVKSFIRLGFGNDDNITGTASSSPSNQSDNYLELYASIKSPMENNVNFNVAFYSLNHSSFPVNNYMFYSAGLDYRTKINDWEITPEVNIIQSTLNSFSFQSVLDLNVSADQKLTQSSRISLSYRYSYISSQNVLYDYLQGISHQIRAEYKDKTALGKIRLRYQLELNNRENSLSTNHSPTRHEFRVRLTQSLKNNWGISEEIDYRLSHYGEVSSIFRNDARFRLKLSARKKIDKNTDAGIRYTYTSNNSNETTEEYWKNKIQINVDWRF